MARASTNPWKYLKRIEFSGRNGELEDMEYPNYPDNCWTLDVAKQTNHTTITSQNVKLHGKFPTRHILVCKFAH